MKRFFSKRWHSIPVGIVAVVLALVLVAGGTLAAVGYGFFTSTLQVQVEEAMVVAIWPDWDNLQPYGSVDDVIIALGGTPESPEISITTIPGYAGAGFVAGESIVIPVNFRNAGDGQLNLGALVSGGGGLVLEYIWQTNSGPASTNESGQDMCREFVASGTWDCLSSWAGTIDGGGGKSGSAVVGAQVLFVRIMAPGNIVAPTTYTFTVTFTRY